MRKSLLIPALLVIWTGLVYSQTLSFSFIGFDDPELITNNPHVRAGLTWTEMMWAFCRAWRENVFFYPLSLITHMVDCTLFGLDAWGHHFSSLLLHTATVVVAFLFLAAVTRAPWRSGFVAGLFAVHPLGADSVAWVAERSNVLCGLFWMTTLLAYVSYCRAIRNRSAWYLFCLALFMLALLAKSTAVTLPVILLTADWLVLDRFKKNPGHGRPPATWPVLAEKIPFFILAGLRAWANIMVPLTTGAAVSTSGTPLGLRLANGLAVYPVYIRRLFFPHDLAIYYPFPDTVALWKPVAALVLLAAITILFFRLRNQRPMAIFGWLWFLIVLTPTLGLVQSGPWPAMADHYVYIPMVGLMAAVTWGVPGKWTLPGTGPARITTAIAIAVLIAAGMAGFYHTRHYKNSIAIFERAVKVTDNNFFVLTGLGNAHAEQGNLEKAKKAFAVALTLQPESPGAHTNLGLVAAAQGAAQNAVDHFSRALAIDPSFAPAHMGMGNRLLSTNRPEAALYHYRQALATDPNLVSAHNNLALALAAAGKTDEAIDHLQKTVSRFPHSPELRRTLSRLLAQTGDRR